MQERRPGRDDTVIKKLERAATLTELERLVRGVPDPVVREFLLMADDSSVAVLPYALAITARLGVADACPPAGSTAEELASAVGFATEPLRSLMNALTGAGFFARDEHGRFALTELGAVLRSDSPVSMRATLSNVGTYRAWLRAVDSPAGSRPFSAGSGEAFFEGRAAEPADQVAFSTRMRERGTRLYAGLADLAVWDAASTVMDIGGGTGTVISAVLRAHPRLSGVLFDRAPVIALAETTAPLDPVRDRCALVAGSFFEGLPAGADVHLLCSVLHDWDDEKAADILRASAASVAPGGRVLVCELVVPSSPAPHPARWSDLGMLMLLGGRERTLLEFDKLFATAGLTRTRVLPVGTSAFSLIETVTA
ncbi:methyltransferase [Actinoplanes palleronii]|uniref:Methyltransferase n=1 Tax=Actinoplanes palleronii TaxID=113570 RepID=A0ABQ4BIW5_9ACTN|nr:methyltransferase [Actinoplanes palleronii]GIE70628.1 methyltransferase [Actinoplanes palleronii]